VPAGINPTVSNLADGGHDLIIVVSKKEVRELIPRLKTAGASAIIESPLQKFVE